MSIIKPDIKLRSGALCLENLQNKVEIRCTIYRKPENLKSLSVVICSSIKFVVSLCAMKLDRHACNYD